MISRQKNRAPLELNSAMIPPHFIEVSDYLLTDTAEERDKFSELTKQIVITERLKNTFQLLRTLLLIRDPSIPFPVVPE